MHRVRAGGGLNSEYVDKQVRRLKTTSFERRGRMCSRVVVEVLDRIGVEDWNREMDAERCRVRDAGLLGCLVFIGFEGQDFILAATLGHFILIAGTANMIAEVQDANMRQVPAAVVEVYSHSKRRSGVKEEKEYGY